MNEGLVAATATTAAIAQGGGAGLDDAELCELLADLETLGRHVDTARALFAAEVEERSRPSLGRDGLAQRHGHTRGAHLVERVTRAGRAEVARRLRVGAAVRRRSGLLGDVLPPHAPALTATMLEGAVGLDAASVILSSLAQAERHGADPAAVRVAEEALADTARVEPADLVAVHARVWREALDPDGALERDGERRARRAFHLGREHDGLTPFSGTADPVSAGLLRAAFAERAGPAVQPRFLDPDDMTDPGHDVADPRTREQRQFDIVFGLLTAGLRSSEGRPGSMRATSTVTAVVHLADLEAGTGIGWLDDVDEPVAIPTIEALACEGGVATLVVGDAGEVLELGRPERLFTAPQRRALAVRDGGCVWPGCSAPPSWCHAHHVRPWQDGGPTDVDNGALLCPAHHHHLHASPFTMRMIRGRPHLEAPRHLERHPVARRVGRSRLELTRELVDARGAPSDFASALLRV